jgi:hypothetical protein
MPVLINNGPAGRSFFVQEELIRAAYRPPFQFNAIDNRSGLKVDFWMLRQEPFDEMMFSRRVHIELFGVSGWIATAEDVILHKLYWNVISPSDRQLGDAAGVVAVSGPELDLAYLRQWANRLGVSTTLEELRKGKNRPKST